jgi:hypothetical protein
MTDQPPRSPGKLGTLAALAVASLMTAWLGCAGDLDPQVRSNWLARDGSATGGGGTGGSGPPPCDAPGTILSSSRCAQGCHMAGAVLGSALDLTRAVIVTNLLGRMSPGTGDSMCGGATKAYLVPGSNPADGLLLDKLFLTSPPCGNRMPIGVYLNPTEETCVRDWATAVTTGRVTQ